MKAMMILTLCLFGNLLFAQQADVDYQKKGDLTDGVFYYENGVISQEGTYKNGKLHGQWISYDRDGKKNTMAYYHKGKKVGKWIFWRDGKMIEVDYNNNEIAEVVAYRIESVYVVD
jgi:antitoxin component YwqK of YwqJK toxin-antitoxin module